MVTQTNKEAFVVGGGGGGCGGSHVRDRGRGKKSTAESHIRPFSACRRFGANGTQRVYRTVSFL